MSISLNVFFEFTGPATETCLALILFRKGRFRSFHAFTALILTDIVTSLALNVIYSRGSAKLYLFSYLTSNILFFSLQLWVIVELARSVIRPAARWVPEARTKFILYSCVGAVVALGATLSVEPGNLHGILLAMPHIEIFGDLLMTEAVIAMLIVSGSFGLGWGSHVMAIGQGMMVLSLTTVAVDGSYLYLPRSSLVSNAAHYLRGILYLVTILYWCVALWREEPARKPISPALRKYIVALHEQVQYDLGKVRH